MGNNPVSTVLDVVTDNKSYYDCPRCGREVWAYGSFKGNICLDCPGTVISSVGSTVNMITCDVADSEPQQIMNFVAPEVTQTVTAAGGILGNIVTGNAGGNRSANGHKYASAKYKGFSVFRISKGVPDLDGWNDDYGKESILSIT
eukprot:CAMPEP_0201586750 /NCGR_PEP_ID=MMETSP0190_2-20130828/135828_1 /ASSEMBLY_ACC=CAM_ASM_000263 /TAXON_ID=37353 /ORGANISM="Rosalina sp." /LENGTH=144 /DNA_ID=CAMNT_0048035303 /DNA_START=74 /DNA_END=504 /DNA_ORIENTATION=+